MEEVLKIAKAEIGYLEKASNKDLDSKTANAGYNNFTKYGKAMGCNGYYWCLAFIEWCFVQAFGREKAKELLCGGFSNYTPTGAQYFKNKGQYFKSPKVGDLVFFRNSQRICHVGIVTKVTSTRIYTIEGNTSGGCAMVRNGGCVAEKNYALNYSKIDGYGRPNYDNIATTKKATKTTKTTFKVGDKVQITASQLNIRKSPNGTILNQMKKGHKSTIKAISNGWGKVCVIINKKTVTGWISLNYVKGV